MKDPTILAYIAKLFTPNAYFRSKVNEERLAELDNLMEALNVIPDKDALDQVLSYFRNCYQTRPFAYPGDFIFYEMLQDCMKKGLTLENSLVITKSIINREIQKLEAAYTFGKNYQENWNIKI